MTQEELKELAKKHAFCVDEDYKKSHNLSNEQIEEMFFDGAEITQINLIDKACEWLHTALYLDHERSIEHRYATLEELLNDFRKAMKGE